MDGNTIATIQRTQYYPSGLPWAEGVGAGEQPYKHNGTEFIEMHGYDVSGHGRRGLHHASGRYTTMDRFAENFPWQSPYVHAANNPVNFVDVGGDSIWTTINTVADNPDGTTSIQTSRYYYGQDSNGNYGFIGNNGEIYAGNDQFVNDLTSALSDLRTQNTGQKLVDYLSEDAKNLNIVQTNGVTTYSTNGILRWNSGGSGIKIQTTSGMEATASFIELGHDLAHAKDYSQGTMNTTEWVQGSGILNAEKYSMHIENQIRAEHGKPLRQAYDIKYPQTRTLGLNNTSRYYYIFDSTGKIVPFKY